MAVVMILINKFTWLLNVVRPPSGWHPTQSDTAHCLVEEFVESDRARARSRIFDFQSNAIDLFRSVLTIASKKEINLHQLKWSLKINIKLYLRLNYVHCTYQLEEYN